MKKVFLLVLAGLLFSHNVYAKTEQKYGCGQDKYSTLKVVGFSDYPPFSWRQEDKEFFNKKNIKRYSYHGFIKELVYKALNEINVTRIENLELNDLKKITQMSKAGKVDLFFTAYYSDPEQSGQDYVFPAYFGNPFVVISRKDKPVDVEDIKELKGMKGVVRNEEGVKPLLVGLLSSDTKIEWVDGAKVALQKLLSGEVDFMIGSPYAAVAEAKRYKVYEKIHLSQKPLRSIKFFVAFPKASMCRFLKKEFSEKFNPMVKNQQEKEKLLNEAIELYVEQNKDEPALTY